eukprot:TRINITY_DN55559_c0_g1_i1.p1 TRINITY_DN55559_c0_g1~~TRINITY_DN55559_c0_g1_i1.p1  ORF type:complete len:669 (-),score=131.72 TRINITY_DN55559_c0_g1_i1:823-2829(-)
MRASCAAPQRCPPTPVASQHHYPWHGPSDLSAARVSVFNSFTATKVPLVPNQPSSNTLSWYICGPTVYDSAHVGHASNYVRFDIVRRILAHYFGYHLRVQMNITDIDDKIITRANERQIPFQQLARHFEAEFMRDMDALNVLRPHYITRVSEYIPDTIEYIQQIIRNGFAYESAGSVYFDTRAFVHAGHHYGKLEPKSVGNEALIAEGEGALSAADQAISRQKKALSDFALWKNSKPAEPFWPSPWGNGRPGWHIECSAMASTVLGPVIDIHVGGEDLRFPHHSNEVAQAEACHNSHQWVNYFLHSGHLHIDGLKMSKSLKNFITIEDWIKRYNSRQIRLAFLAHRYSAPMNYTDHGMEEAINLDSTFIHFFGTLKATLRDISKCDINSRQLRAHESETQLFAQLSRCQTTVHDALADDFDTPTALRELQTLVRSTNAYVAAKGVEANQLALESVGRYVTKMFKVFGLVAGGADIAYGDDASSSAVSREKALAPVLDAFCRFRDSIRQAARRDGAEAIGNIMSLCDAVRDEVLPPLGVRLEDRGVEQCAVWKLEDAATLVMEIERKKEAEQKRREEKAKQKAAREAKLRQDLERGKVAPQNMFREGEYAGRYSEFDDNGMPTKDSKGNALSKSALKALLKARVRQQKLHDKYVASVSAEAENGTTLPT